MNGAQRRRLLPEGQVKATQRAFAFRSDGSVGAVLSAGDLVSCPYCREAHEVQEGETPGVILYALCGTHLFILGRYGRLEVSGWQVLEEVVA